MIMIHDQWQKSTHNRKPQGYSMNYSYRLVCLFSRGFKQGIRPSRYSRGFKIQLNGEIFRIVSLDLGFLKIIQLRAIQYQPIHNLNIVNAIQLLVLWTLNLLLSMKVVLNHTLNWHLSFPVGIDFCSRENRLCIYEDNYWYFQLTVEQ